MSIIDTHVHLRDFNEAYKETIKHGLEVARDSGVSAVFDMPNTNPPLIDEEIIKQRIALADDANVANVFYGCYGGLTANAEQVKKIVEVYRKYFPRVVGLKLYAGHSTNNMGIIWEKDQLKLYKTLAEAGYNGVLFIHAEKESEIVPNLFYSGFPITHCFARSPDAEIQSIYDQIRFAEEAKFNGKMHIAHISTAEGVELVQEARKRGLNISCGVTPHHLIFDWRIMYKKDGLKWKMNPPLRYPGVPEKLFSCLKEGKIDWIETDHAPHTIDDKYKNLASGIPALPWWPLFIEYLRRYNFSDQRIKEITRDNILKRFNLDIRAHAHHLKDHRADYAFNPYEPLEKMLDWPVM